MQKQHFLVCPKCGVRRFLLKNAKGETVLVNVTRSLEIVPVNENDNIEGFDTEKLYCVGCSWVGSKHKLIKYLLVN